MFIKFTEISLNFKQECYHTIEHVLIKVIISYSQNISKDYYFLHFHGTDNLHFTV